VHSLGSKQRRPRLTLSSSAQTTARATSVPTYATPASSHTDPAPEESCLPQTSHPARPSAPAYAATATTAQPCSNKGRGSSAVFIQATVQVEVRCH
jgi:hypothetical protein